MMRLKVKIILLILIFVASYAEGHSLLGIYGGFNRPTFHDRVVSPKYHSDFDPLDTYILGIHYKQRKDQVIQLALTLDYLKRSTYAHVFWEAVDTAARMPGLIFIPST